MLRILLTIEKAGNLAWAIFGTLLLIGVTILDFVTGSELSFSIFYLIPILFFTWVFSASVGVGVACISAAIWLLTELLTTGNHDTFAYLWNTIIRLGFFLLPAVLLKSLEQERIHARTDYLTGAINNRYFNEILDREIQRSLRYKHPFTLAFLDLDNFKVLNDTFGHTFGDKILKTIAECMRLNLRKTDLVSRISGDEFAILLPETNSEEAKVAISNLFQKINNEMQVKKWPVTFSVGVLTSQSSDTSADKILKAVDKLMYIVKNNGKNNIKYATHSNEE